VCVIPVYKKRERGSEREGRRVTETETEKESETNSVHKRKSKAERARARARAREREREEVARKRLPAHRRSRRKKRSLYPGSRAMAQWWPRAQGTAPTWSFQRSRPRLISWCSLSLCCALSLALHLCLLTHIGPRARALCPYILKCMYSCMFTLIYAYIHAHTHICIHTHTHTHTHTHVVCHSSGRCAHCDASVAQRLHQQTGVCALRPAPRAPQQRAQNDLTCPSWFRMCLLCSCDLQ
jgi:hypothetical protein